MGQAPRVQSQVQSGSDSKPGWFGSYGWALGYKTWVGKTMECVQFKVQAKKKLKSKPTFWDGTGPRGPNSGSIRVRLALRLRISPDFSVSTCFVHVQSTIMGKKRNKYTKTTIDSM